MIDKILKERKNGGRVVKMREKILSYLCVQNSQTPIQKLFFYFSSYILCLELRKNGIFYKKG